MIPEPLDVVENITWKELKRKKNRKESEFITFQNSDDPIKDETCCLNTTMRLLPSPAVLPVNKLPAVVPVNKIKIIEYLKSKIPRIQIQINPAMIIGCIHVIFNAFVLVVVLYVVFSLLYFMTVDVLYKISKKKEETRALIEEAKRLYVINRCDPTTRVPALESQCGGWDGLVKNGMSGIKYTKIVVEMCAGMIDVFVKKL